MKRGLTGLVAAVLLLASTTNAAADNGCRPDQKLTLAAKTGPATSAGTPQVILSRGVEARLIQVTCESTACVAGLYDGDALSDIVGTTTIPLIETGAPASVFKLVPDSGFFEQPVEFSQGIVFKDDGNVAFLSVWECSQR